jgi:hypothetical protein
MKKRESIEPDLYVVNKKLTEKERQELSAFIEAHNLKRKLKKKHKKAASYI